MLFRVLPLFAGIAPFVAVTWAYWLGVATEQLPSCFPYFDGCTSISSTGRKSPGSFVFKGVQLPIAVILMTVWFVVARWLRSLSNADNRYRTIVAFGVVGASALIIYTVFLGTREPVYEFMRRFGIYVYFAGTVFAQLLTSLALRRHALEKSGHQLVPAARWLLVFALLPFVLGVLNIFFKSILDDADRMENRIEWIAALSMQVWFVFLYWSWRTTNIQFLITTGPTSEQR